MKLAAFCPLHGLILAKQKGEVEKTKIRCPQCKSEFKLESETEATQQAVTFYQGNGNMLAANY
ncbi:MAG: hypothetical protein M1150_01365 [Patescibacteria group bacterium]|nr:hypothetical protein [Patescibacteria group bacterium]